MIKFVLGINVVVIESRKFSCDIYTFFSEIPETVFLTVDEPLLII